MSLHMVIKFLLNFYGFEDNDWNLNLWGFEDDDRIYTLCKDDYQAHHECTGFSKMIIQIPAIYDLFGDDRT